LIAIARRKDENLLVLIKHLTPLKTRYAKTAREENKKPHKPNANMENSMEARIM